MTPLQSFAATLNRPDLAEYLGTQVIGDGVAIDGPFGPKPLVYADYVASGRALFPVENFVMQSVLPYYANSHTEASFCGAFCTRLRAEARAEIARIAGVGPDCSVVFGGAGATAGINRIIGLLAIRDRVARGEDVRIFIGPYEHHSNLLPWRECGADVVEIPESVTGGPDTDALRQALEDAEGADLIVGSFSAASNVTGICAPVDEVTAILKRHGALSIWDYAGGAPYMPFDMGQGASAKDAIVYSSHKFPGGPGASGVLIARDTIVRRDTPSTTGGGTVSFVSPWSHHYSTNVVAREEAGTPNVVGDVRAALVMLVKEAIGQSYITDRNRHLREQALSVWRRNPRIELLGNLDARDTLPIFAYRVRRGDGRLFHHQLFTRMLSDRYGIQARGGCACAGSYAHSLLGIDRAQSDDIVARLNRGEEMCKPGWVRLNFSYLLSDDKADFIVKAVDELASTCDKYESGYIADPKTARFRPTPAADQGAARSA